jgi:hypothetical protein
MTSAILFGVDADVVKETWSLVEGDYTHRLDVLFPEVGWGQFRDQWGEWDTFLYQEGRSLDISFALRVTENGVKVVYEVYEANLCTSCAMRTDDGRVREVILAKDCVRKPVSLSVFVGMWGSK